MLESHAHDVLATPPQRVDQRHEVAVAGDEYVDAVFLPIDQRIHRIDD